MKHLYLILVVLITTTTLYAQNVTIPDSTFKAFLIGNAVINTNGDTEIQVSEASAYSGGIICSNLGINDLTGIEAFVNINTLWCENNNLTSLDLSNNTALVFLRCGGDNFMNLNVTMNTALEKLHSFYSSITSLDVTQNIALEEFLLMNSNVSTIDVSNNVNLKTLNVRYSPLDSLNLTNNIALEVLKVGHNVFPTVDISNNLNLRYFESFGGKNLVYLDLSNNPALQILDLRDNKLVWLNLANGNNSNITTFITTGNPNLTCIQVDTVAYSVANWAFGIDPTSSFSTNCGSCMINIPDVNLKAALLANIAINTNGDTEIQCEEAANYTGVISVSSLNITDMTGINSFSRMTELDCSGNQIDTLKIFGNLKLTDLDISNNPSLQYLNCTDNNLSTLNVSSNPNLDLLYCNNNSLSSIDLSMNANLRTLYIYGNNLSTLDVSNNLNLEYLSSYGNNLTTLDVIQNTKLNTLYVHNNNLTTLDVSQDTSLVALTAYRNNLENLNLRNLSTTKLTYLDVTDNPNLTCIDATDVAAATATWTNIDSQSYFSATTCFNSTKDLPLVQSIKVYPNPTTGKINVDLGQETGNVNIIVHNLMGQMISSSTYENRSNINFEIQSSRGVYFVTVVSETGEQTTLKVVKE